MPGDSHPTGSPHHPAQRMPGQEQASRHGPEAGSRPRSWEATLWGRHIRCHELDQHLYLDGRYLDLTPIEFGLFWLLLRQALQANTSLAHQELARDECTSATIPERHLQRLGIVPTLDL